MVNFAGLACAIVMLTAQTPHLVAPGTVEAATRAKIRVVAVDARVENRAQKHFDRGLESVKPALKDLDYDAFYLLKSAEVNCDFDKQTDIQISADYTLHVTPIEKTADGRVRLRCQITMPPKTPGGESVSALNTTLLMAPGKHLNLGGLKLKDGELIVVLSLRG